MGGLLTKIEEFPVQATLSPLLRGYYMLHGMLHNGGGAQPANPQLVAGRSFGRLAACSSMATEPTNARIEKGTGRSVHMRHTTDTLGDLANRVAQLTGFVHELVFRMR